MESAAPLSLIKFFVFLCYNYTLVLYKDLVFLRSLIYRGSPEIDYYDPTGTEQICISNHYAPPATLSITIYEKPKFIPILSLTIYGSRRL